MVKNIYLILKFTLAKFIFFCFSPPLSFKWKIVVSHRHKLIAPRFKCSRSMYKKWKQSSYKSDTNLLSDLLKLSLVPSWFLQGPTWLLLDLNGSSWLAQNICTGLCLFWQQTEVVPLQNYYIRMDRQTSLINLKHV